MAIKQVRVQINGTWTVLSYNSTTKKYEATLAAPSITSFNQSGGYYPITVEASDMAGNIITKNSSDATLGASLRLTVKEVTAPVLTLVSPGEDSMATTSVVPLVFRVRDETNGSGISLSSLRVTLDGTNLTNTSPGMVCTQVTGGYDITYTPQSGLPDGSHVAHFVIQDNDGNMAAPKSVNFIIDTVPPALSVTNPVNSTTYTNVSIISVTGVTTDTTSGMVKVKITNGSTVYDNILPDGSGNFTQSVTLTAGTNTVVIRATDAAGKFSEVTRTIILDTIAPTISAVTITPNPVNVGVSFTISIDAADV